jgi:hypothetical protein
MKRQTLYVLLILCITQFAYGQKQNLLDLDRFAFEPDLRVNSSIPTPADHLGYELGAEFTLYAHAVDYFQTLAEASPRVAINQYGETYEGRPLINLVISSEENINNLEEIRMRHLELLTATESEAESIINETPVFTSFSYNIHGNEASSTEAAMQVAYRMAAAQDEETREVLDNSVIIMYICINPDGRDRYVYWYKGMHRNVPGIEPTDLEHYAPWPNGRTNHYWFDLNRDWIWGIHPESRGHTAEYQRWMPQVHVDYHEQGYNSNYFTMPGTTPRNKQLPDSYEALTDTFGMANVRAFDKNRLNYFTRQAFDFFYPGYGSSYPSVMGAIGMLTEQGGIGAGLAVETNDGYKLTLRQRVFDHYTTSVATIKKAAERREELLRYSYEAWQPERSKVDTKGYFIPADQTYSTDVVNMLLRQGVTVERTTSETILPDGVSMRDGERGRRVLPEGTYVISTDQTRSLFITSIMERNMAIEDSVMYDMATWSAPLAYNLDCYTTSSRFTADTEEVTEPLAEAAGLTNSNAQYAYVIEWKQRNAPKALAMLWDKEYRVRAAEEPFTDGERTFGEGTLVILRGRNLDKDDQMVDDLQSIAEEAGVEIVGYDSGRMAGGWDLASSSNRPVKQPKVALMVEPPFDTYTCGQLYFLFDQETHLPVERIRTSILQQTAMPKFGRRYGGADLLDYDVLILPDGGSGLRQLFQKEQLAELKAWVQGGGVLIANESAAGFFTKGQSEFTGVEIKEAPEDSSEVANYLPYNQRRDYYGKKRIPGSALTSKLDTTHPLAFGMNPDLYSLKFGNTGMKPSSDLETVGYYVKDKGDLLVAGYASDENLEHLAGTTFAGVVNMGSGKVVFLADNTQYRMFWRGPSRLMQNAVMLLPGF